MLLVNYFDLLELYLNDLTKQKIPIKDILNNEIENYKKALAVVNEKFAYKVETEFKKFEPVIQWAQKHDYVMMEIILADSFETAACTSIENEFIDILTHGLEINGLCSSNKVLKKFDLKLNYFDEILKLNSNYNYVEEGRYIIYLRKKTQFEWELLSKSDKHKVRVWKEMQDKFDEEENKEDNADEDEQIVVKPAKNKKRKSGYVIRGKEYKDSYIEG